MRAGGEGAWKEGKKARGSWMTFLQGSPKFEIRPTPLTSKSSKAYFLSNATQWRTFWRIWLEWRKKYTTNAPTQRPKRKDKAAFIFVLRLIFKFPLFLGGQGPFLTQCAYMKPTHEFTFQVACKSVECFKQAARMWETDDRPRYEGMCTNRRNRLRRKKRFRLKQVT